MLRVHNYLVLDELANVSNVIIFCAVFFLLW